MTEPRSVPLRAARVVVAAVLGLTGVLMLGTAAPAQGRPASTGPDRGPGLDEWWRSQLHISRAQRQATGTGVKVAMIDGGLNASLPEFRGADIHFSTTSCLSETPSRPSKRPGALHGSDMTSLVVGQGRGNAPGGRGRLGIAPDAGLTFYVDSQRQTQSVPCAGVGIGPLVRRAVDDGADIINMSFVTDHGDSLDSAIDYAVRKKVVLVAAAGLAADYNGKDGYLPFPQGRPGVVTVLATDAKAQPFKDNAPGRQGHGTLGDRYWATVSAPGVDMQGFGIRDGRWVSEGGTASGSSDSAAVVTGMLALLKSKYPAATGNQLIQALIHTPPGSKGYAWDGTYGFGIASVSNMLKRSPTGWPDVNPLLGSPEDAVRKFPLSSYDTTPATKSDQTGAKQTSGDASKQSSSPQPAASSSGTPGWVWPLAGVVLVGLVGGGVLLARRRT